MGGESGAVISVIRGYTMTEKDGMSCSTTSTGAKQQQKKAHQMPSGSWWNATVYCDRKDLRVE